MATGYIPLPAARWPTNAALDFEPLNRAIDANRKHELDLHNAMLADKQDSRAAEDQGMQRTTFGNQQEDRTIAAVGKRALAAYRQTDPAKRKAMWDGVLARHPNRAGLAPEYLDPNTGPELAVAEAGLLPDPLEQQERQAKLGLIGAQTENARGEAGERARKAAFDKQIFDMINGGSGDATAPAAPPAATPVPGYQPQSYQPSSGNLPMMPTPVSRGGAPLPFEQQTQVRRGDQGPQSAAPQMRPGVILAADDMPYAGGPAPTQQPRQRPPGPMDGLSPQQRAAFGLGLMGKGDAGKILLDASNANRPDKTAQTDVDKAEIRATNGLARLNEISASFDPSFLTYQTQVGNWGRALIDKTGKLKPESQAKLYKFATFRRDAARNINDAIKENSGATVTEQELARNLVELPNAGSGMLDGDSPTEFKAKLDRARETLTLGVARFRYLRQKGFTGAPWESGIELGQMRDIINQRAQAIVGELKQQNPQASQAMLEQEADLRVKQEFGI